MPKDRYNIWIDRALHDRLADQAAILTAATGKRVTISSIITAALEEYFERNGLSEHTVNDEAVARLRELLDKLSS